MSFIDIVLYLLLVHWFCPFSQLYLYNVSFQYFVGASDIASETRAVVMNQAGWSLGVVILSAVNKVNIPDTDHSNRIFENTNYMFLVARWNILKTARLLSPS